MSNMKYLVDSIRRRIPETALIKGLMPQRQLGKVIASLDWFIEHEIIYRWVLADLNVVSGTETTINISNCVKYFPGQGMAMVVEIGMGPTNGRKISSVLSIGYGNIGAISGKATITSAVVDQMVMSDARVQLIANNVIYIDGYTTMPVSWLRCILENDDNFNNVPQRAIKKLSAICVEAAKAHLYNVLKLRISSGEIIQGIPMPVLSEIINEYASAEEKYDALVDAWPSVMTLADPVAKQRWLRMLTPQ